MSNLIESIREYGVISPAMVRKKEDGRYEMISGHRRKRACELLGMETLRCEIVDVNRDEATVLMVDSNSQRSVIAPCDKGKAYKMRMDALNRQGKRTDLTSAPVGQKLKPVNSRDEIAAFAKESARQISRLIRLTYRIPELQQYVDAGKIKMRPAVELSYLNEEAQRKVFDVINEAELFPSHGQAICMRKAFESRKLDQNDIKAILSERKPKQPATLRILADRIENIIPSGITPKELEDYVVKALKYYRRYLQRQRDDAR